MGTWGVKTFENDTALDWLEELCNDPTGRCVRESLLQETACDSPDAVSGVRIVCACEIINALLNGPREGMPDKALAWIAENKTLDVRDLRDICVRGLDKVLAAESELRELWEESENYDTWRSSVLDLRAKLRKKRIGRSARKRGASRFKN